MPPTSTPQNLNPSSSDVSAFREIGDHRDSGSDCLSDEVDLESGELEVKILKKTKKERRDCRICHLGLVDNSDFTNNSNNNGGRGEAIELGCSCKGDLGAAHRKCAETWFKIKGNTVCEICGATAVNIAGEQTNEERTAATAAAAVSSVPVAPVILVEHRTVWHSRRVMNILLACTVLAFVISWLFHFKALS